MALETALHALGEPANEHINWAIGDLLRERAIRDDWRECPLLRQLETDARLGLSAWNALFRRTREALTDDADLPRKARILLSPACRSFDQSLEDFIAEMMAAIYLSHLGHGAVRFLSEEDSITTDLISVLDDISYVTEVKNLREPRSLAYVAFARWHHNRAANLGRFNFLVEFLDIDDPFDDLTRQQADAVRDCVDGLPDRNRPSVFEVTLPSNRTLRIRVSEGPGGMIQDGPGPFQVAPLVEECQRAVVLKLLDPAKKALTQLYSSAVPADFRRLLFVRWKPPDSIAAIEESGTVRDAVRQNYEAFIRQFSPNFALVILCTTDETEDAPIAAW